MKKIIFSTAALALVFIFQACTKEKTITLRPTETAPISQIFFVNNWFKMDISGTGAYEYGCLFHVTIPGKIVQIGSKMPDTGSYRVVLWDSATKTSLAEKTFTAFSNSLHMEDITPVALTTGKTYLISVFSKNVKWFNFTRYGGGNLTYPFTSGSVVVTGYQWVGNSGSSPLFPTINSKTYVAGLADFVFKPD